MSTKARNWLIGLNSLPFLSWLLVVLPFASNWSMPNPIGWLFEAGLFLFPIIYIADAIILGAYAGRGYMHKNKSTSARRAVAVALFVAMVALAAWEYYILAYTDW